MELRRNPKIIKEKHLKIVSDYKAGLPIREIAKRNKCSIGLIYYVIHKVV